MKLPALPLHRMEDMWARSLDQKMLRDILPTLGIVSFVGDGFRPARSFTRHRCFFRTAGLKHGVNIPFYCPQELSPV
jgi:predicted ABC-class ATPase